MSLPCRLMRIADSVFRSYKSLGLPLSGWFSAKPMFDQIAEETHEAYLA